MRVSFVIGQLYIISAASGTGKTSLIKELTKNMPDVAMSISYTTRPKRASEQDGVDYFFVSLEEFKELESQGDFLETACVFGKYYGTSKTQVEKLLHKGLDVILEIDWQGAQKVRQKLNDTKSIFILPPSKEELEKRLLKRNQDDLQVIERRLSEAGKEISHADEFDYLVINDEFSKALTKLTAIILAGRSESSKMTDFLQKLNTI
jgi:guanylate kinase